MARFPPLRSTQSRPTSPRIHDRQLWQLAWRFDPCSGPHGASIRPVGRRCKRPTPPQPMIVSIRDSVRLPLFEEKRKGLPITTRAPRVPQGHNTSTRPVQCSAVGQQGWKACEQECDCDRRGYPDGRLLGQMYIRAACLPLSTP